MSGGRGTVAVATVVIWVIGGAKKSINARRLRQAYPQGAVRR